jgi:hypothetical protein
LGIAAALAGAAAIVTLSVAPVAGQAKSAIPRDPQGRPDLQGIWSYATVTPLERPDALAGKATFNSDEELAEFERSTVQARNHDNRSGAGTNADVSRAYNDFWWDRGTRVLGRQTSLVVDPPDGRIPALTPQAQQRQAQRAEARRAITTDADNPEDRSLWERCVTRALPMLPGAYNNNIKIVQTKDYVMVMQEMIHEARIIPTDGRPHSKIRQWHGSSRGRWEGDTLVVETINFTDLTSFQGATENMHLVERFTRINADTLIYEYTVTDPAAFVRPFTVSIPMTRTDSKIYEYACHEGNYGMTNLLSGARAIEKAAKEAALKGSK